MTVPKHNGCALSARASRVLHVGGREDYSVESFAAQHRNAKSAASRRHNLRKFFEWLDAQEIHVLAVEAADVIRFIDTMRQTYAESTCMTMQRSVRAYYRWLEQKGTISANPVAHIKEVSIPRRPPKYVPPEDVKRMLDASTSDRNWAFLSIIAFNSLRLSELLGCNVADFQYEEGRAILHFRPNAESRSRRNYVVLADSSAEVLTRYIANRKSGPLFLTREGKRLERGGASGSVFVQTAERAGLGYKVTPDMVTNCLPVTALQRGFSYRGIVRAIGIPDRRHSNRWLNTAQGTEADNASLRLARLVLTPPDNTANILQHVESLLLESDLPQGFAVVAACAAFEAHLYELCLAHELEVPEERKDGKISKYVHNLYRAKILTLAELKQTESISVARNHAAHGAFDLLEPEAGRRILRSVRELVSTHPLP
jgi:integrase/recombinase XerD